MTRRQGVRVGADRQVGGKDRYPTTTTTTATPRYKSSRRRSYFTQGKKRQEANLKHQLRMHDPPSVSTNHILSASRDDEREANYFGRKVDPGYADKRIYSAGRHERCRRRDILGHGLGMRRSKMNRSRRLSIALVVAMQMICRRWLEIILFHARSSGDAEVSLKHRLIKHQMFGRSACTFESG